MKSPGSRERGGILESDSSRPQASSRGGRQAVHLIPLPHRMQPHVVALGAIPLQKIRFNVGEAFG